jgi:hypothetical protein
VLEHFVLIASDSENTEGEIVSGYTVAMRRLKTRGWAVYRRTQNRRRLKVGDKLLIYAAGAQTGGGTFVASATVGRLSAPKNSLIGKVEFMNDIPEYIMEFADIHLFVKPVEIRSLRDRLAFVPKHSRWGSVLQGGCKKIGESDFDIILMAERTTDAVAVTGS